MCDVRSFANRSILKLGPCCLEIALIGCERFRMSKAVSVFKNVSTCDVCRSDMVDENKCELIETRLDKMMEVIALELLLVLLDHHCGSEARDPIRR